MIYTHACIAVHEHEQLKVMREVRALAKLENHLNVVRYNISWKERAPADWKTREHWSKLKESDIMYVSWYFLCISLCFVFVCLCVCTGLYGCACVCICVCAFVCAHVQI